MQMTKNICISVSELLFDFEIEFTSNLQWNNINKKWKYIAIGI